MSVFERKSQALAHSRLHSQSLVFMKRAFDIATALLLLLILAPTLILISVACLAADWGPIFYVHQRIGHRGKSFGCLKFRTMRRDAAEVLADILKKDAQARIEWEAQQKLKNDPRVTPVGKVLRKLSLDELPQLINVLRGDMSLVGPRPVVMSELEKHYRGAARDAYVSVRPGITGLWQVSGRSDTDYVRRVSLDCEYVYTLSLRTDLSLLAKTAVIVVRRDGAY